MTLDSLLFWLKNAINYPVSSVIDRENVPRPIARVTHLYQSYLDGRVLTSCSLDLCGTVDVSGMAEIWAELHAGTAVFYTAKISTLDLTQSIKNTLYDAISSTSGKTMAPHLPVLHITILRAMFGDHFTSTIKVEK